MSDKDMYGQLNCSQLMIKNLALLKWLPLKGVDNNSKPEEHGVIFVVNIDVFF